MSKNLVFERLADKFSKQVLPKIMRKLGNEAVNFFTDNITRGITVRGVPFKPRAYELKNRRGRSVLIQTGELRRSIEIKKIDVDSVEIGSDLEYAKTHNEGGEIPVTPQMRKFFWAKYYEANKRVKTTKKGTISQNKANIQVSNDAKFWQNMALNKSDKIQMPRRQFIGDSKQLRKILSMVIEKELKKL
jgi:phage gpG-like protein